MIKILFLAANPLDTERLRLDKEMQAIDAALRQGEFREQFDIRSHWAVRISDLQELFLRHQPNIVHFSGHGSDRCEIILEDNAGNSQPVSASALSQLFVILKDNIRCVVLNLCYSELQAQAIAEHIDCVVGMSNVITDAASIKFCTSFYLALCYGRDVQTAFDLGRLEIGAAKLGEQDIPILLALNSNPSEIVFVDVKQIDIGELIEVLKQSLPNDARPEQFRKYLTQIRQLTEALYEWKELHDNLDRIINAFGPYVTQVERADAIQRHMDPKLLLSLWHPVQKEIELLLTFAKNIKIIGTQYEEFKNGDMVGEEWAVKINALRKHIEQHLKTHPLSSSQNFLAKSLRRFQSSSELQKQWWNSLYELTGQFGDLISRHMTLADKSLRDTSTDLYRLSRLISQH